MKVLIVNTFDRGGAANACLRLHEGLLQDDVNASLLLKAKLKNHSNVEVLRPVQLKKSLSKKIKDKLKVVLKEFKLLKKKPISKEVAFIRNRHKGLELFSFPNSEFDLTESKLYREADVVNLHWVASFLDYTTFFEKNIKPVVWTLHDMYPFTGGEHYEESHLGIDDSGFPIKRAKTEAEIEFSSKNNKIVLDALKKCDNLSIVAPSQWLADEAKKSDAFKNRQVHCIPYGLNSEVFKPRDREYSRELLNIPKDKKVVLFVADSITNNRKGYAYLKKAIKQIERDDVVLCAIGHTNGHLENISNVLELGTIYDERLMSIAYSAADVFVIPSLMDNLPNTVLESLMCGTPVIGFPAGGITDMVQHGINGLLTKEISVNALLESLENFLNSIKSFDRTKIRTEAVKKYDLKIQASAYTDLYRDILKTKTL